jgi:hypothetical protein
LLSVAIGSKNLIKSMQHRLKYAWPQYAFVDYTKYIHGEKSWTKHAIQAGICQAAICLLVVADHRK